MLYRDILDVFFKLQMSEIGDDLFWDGCFGVEYDHARFVGFHFLLEYCQDFSRSFFTVSDLFEVWKLLLDLLFFKRMELMLSS